MVKPKNDEPEAPEAEEELETNGEAEGQEEPKPEPKPKPKRRPKGPLRLWDRGAYYGPKVHRVMGQDIELHHPREEANGLFTEVSAGVAQVFAEANRRAEDAGPGEQPQFVIKDRSGAEVDFA